MAINKYRLDENDKLVSVPCTAREYAKDIVFDALNVCGYWTERDCMIDQDLSEDEKNNIQKYVDKFRDRFQEMLKIK